MSGLRVFAFGVLFLALCLNVVDAECDPEIKKKAGTRITPQFGDDMITAFDASGCMSVPKGLNCYVEVEDPPGCTGSVNELRMLTSNCKTVNKWIVRDGAPCSLASTILGATVEKIDAPKDVTSTTTESSDAPLNDISSASFLCLLATAFFGLIV